MRTALITITAGRLAHLRNQLRAVAAGTRTPDDHIVVSMGDPAVLAELRAGPAHGRWLPARTPLPLAAARNLGAATALERGAELLVFLDVDCLPDPVMIERYQQARNDSHAPDAVDCGPVTYLPPPPPGGYDLADLPRCRAPHPARPAPPDEMIWDAEDYGLFWSLSFAVAARTWSRLGGFDPTYRGYGAEDTDFGFRARAAAVPLRWVGGAHAYHQHHPVSDPPVEHLADILRNARLFHRRWGSWPMRGWLDAFTDLGLLTPVGGALGWVPGAHAQDGIGDRTDRVDQEEMWTSPN
ncbi:glycosyltransferase family 2 protein [Nocardia yunnanensis]|uniref:glycosyltransferase family 2 protein n=1 Tax=Nocardia yunnanensis TaxID=2382165 RepID=UPI0013C40338|nr:glycosyltransferase family 2 protein [Nocardia yunnanensis]